MSIKNRMHPRNIYRKSPDYSELALLYPEFMKAAYLDLNGKVKLNFKDVNALRVLTKCLLHKDFGLSVEIPLDRLVPTLPLRLNYILWIEDLFCQCNIKQNNILGIDIGTGACAIYSLLAAAKNKWSMIGTENDEVNFEVACKNVQSNNLQSMITVKKADGDSVLMHCFSIKGSLEKVDFCICNPPFYATLNDVDRSRSLSRPPPRNARTGCVQELTTDGGEVAFVSKLIAESKILTSRVSIYTTMLGHKTSLKALIKVLKDNGVEKFTHTEFCQGRTTRWGLAWTFSSDCSLRNSSSSSSKDKLKEKGISIAVPRLQDREYKVITTVNVILKILDSINVKYKHIQRKESKVILELSAECNSWSNQRRKRRSLKMSDRGSKKVCDVSSDEIVETKKVDVIVDDNSNNVINGSAVVETKTQQTENQVIPESDISSQENVSEISNLPTDQLHPTASGGDCNNVESVRIVPETDLNSPSQSVQPKVNHGKSENKLSVSKTLQNMIYLKSLMTVSYEQDLIILEMKYLDGVGGKDNIHQILQYIKNNWNNSNV